MDGLISFIVPIAVDYKPSTTDWIKSYSARSSASACDQLRQKCMDPSIPSKDDIRIMHRSADPEKRNKVQHSCSIVPGCSSFCVD